MTTINGSEEYWLNLFAGQGLLELLKDAKTNGWEPIWNKVEDLCQNLEFSFKDEIEKHVFLDVFASYSLSFIEPATDSQAGLALCKLIEKWKLLRKMPERYSSLSAGEQGAAVYFCLKLRDKMKELFLNSSNQSLGELPENYQQILLSLWSQLFLNTFSPLHLIEMKNMFDDKKIFDELNFPGNLQERGCLRLLAASMYFPNDAGKFAIDSQLLIKEEIPLFIKIIIIRWMVYIPYFNGAMEHRDRLVKYVPELCLALTDNPDFLSQMLFLNIVQEIMAGFWRASYIGGNNLAALNSFGDFISNFINRFCPLPPPVKRRIKAGEKIRVGYISRNFFQQAVSYYMINRIIYHDRDKFEVFIYSLDSHKDGFTDIFQKNCSHFKEFPDIKNFTPIVSSIIKDKLDILIYTDIGMDAVTYILAGLKLAPVQCALVGHGTTTGLPTIDYYLSGDFESLNAQEQYREKLIRLSNLGAAQYLPEEPLQTISREDLGIPKEAVVYISCANGIKHRPERDRIFIEILKKAPNAWIILKPYTAKDGIDGKMAKRLRTLAEEAQVSDRLLILPSVGHYRAVLGLLKISDVQLDTYPYGGWTTNLEALYVGLPIITQEGELSRSRWGGGMLRALGITEGIAKDEAGYIEQAVLFANDVELRRRISEIIKTKAQEIFFNGQAAQASFEAALIGILENTADNIKVDAPEVFFEKNGQVNIVLPKKIFVVTSIAPRNFFKQKEAMATWLAAGFTVVSLNAADEIGRLREEFPEIKFETVDRDARQMFKRPYVFFDDILAFLRRAEGKAGGIINSDIYLMEQASGLPGLVAQAAKNSLIFGSRLEVASPQDRKGKIYETGFDYFFLGENVLKVFPKEDFCLGLPWWDYWAVLVPFEAKMSVQRLVSPIVRHVSHQTAWEYNAWIKLGLGMAGHISPPDSIAVSPKTLPMYIYYLATRINKESIDIVL